MQTLRDLSPQNPSYRLDKDFYDQVLAIRSEAKMISRLVIPGFSGRGFTVKKGQSFRIIQEEGPQVGDLVLFNTHDTRESFRSIRTWAMEGWFVKRYTRLWSNVPWFRPMATCIDVTLDFESPGSEWHHHVVASHCSPEAVEMRWGQVGANVCGLNLLQAVEPFGLGEDDIYDNLDIFQKWSLDPRAGTYANDRNDCGKGDYIEFYAEMDLIAGVSVCPTGDNTVNFSTPEDNTVSPLAVEIYETGVEPKEFPTWGK